jgi:SAM-dependent methyltransferase
VRNFERHGLDSTAAAMIATLRERGVAGATLLDVGAGPGTATVTLLEAGMSAAVAYDISPSHERVAGALLQGRGLTDRVEWHTGDYLTADDRRTADVVFLNRVVCCHPQGVDLMTAVAPRSGSLLAVSYPRPRWWVRLGLRGINGYLRLRKIPFRVFVHDPMALAAAARDAGLKEAASGGTAAWEWKVWERSAP